MNTRPTDFMRHLKIHFLVLFLALVFASPASWAQDDDRTAGQSSTAIDSTSETYRQLNLFGDVFERVRAQYVEEVGDEELIESAINGMLTELDPHSHYLDQDDFTEMQVQTKGEFGGLGIEVTMENGFVKVVTPIDETPAARAGIEAGDYITHLNGEAVMGMTLSDAVDIMRGKVGTTIDIIVRRVDEADPIELTIKRDIIKIRSVRHKVLQDDIGYVRITAFNQNTESGLKNAVKDIKKQVGDNLKGYILDLRNNPGGLLDQAIAVSDAFLDKGEIVSTRGRYKRDTKRDNATSGDIIDGMPLVVLINGGSASASEIVAGALQDHRRAILMGIKSFGKGSVQTVVPLPGHGAMKLTTARYYTPSGRSIQAKGIEPDIIVEQAKIEALEKMQRMREADLRGALKNPSDVDEILEDEEAILPFKDIEEEGEEGETEEEKKQREDVEALLNDYQLSRAVDLIRGVSLYGLKMGDLKLKN